MPERDVNAAWCSPRHRSADEILRLATRVADRRTRIVNQAGQYLARERSHRPRGGHFDLGLVGHIEQ
jgi:hypothetical protein